MYKRVKIVSEFKPVPYLASADIMKTHPNGVEFDTKKVNVILGPNGSGKSALLTTMAHATFAFPAGRSAFDEYYTRFADQFWSKEKEWGEEEFMKGLEIDYDMGSTLYYKPSFVPGDYADLTHAMMCGYSAESNKLHKLTNKKSSGQKSIATLKDIREVLTGKAEVPKFGFINWGHAKDIKDIRRHSSSHLEYRANCLLKRFADRHEGTPAILMDEPEQSLDTLNEIMLWNDLANADLSKGQVIVATHSMYPIIHSDKFNLIETVPGFIDAVKAQIKIAGL